MIDLNGLRIFERLSAVESFSEAARVLGLPKSSVSRAISGLEAQLGARLIQRSSRGFALTEAGEALLGRIGDPLLQLDDALLHVSGSGDAPRGRLRISAGVGFSVNVLSEHLPRFLEEYPDIEIELEVSSRTADLVREGVDLAVRMGALPDSSMIAVPLTRIPRFICASPEYLRRRGSPETPADLATHQVVDMWSGGRRAQPWRLLRGSEAASVRPTPRVLVNDTLSLHRLVRNHVGIGLVSGLIAGEDLDAGRLVRLLPGWAAEPVEVNVVFPSRRELSPAVRAFVAFLRKVPIHAGA